MNGSASAEQSKAPHGPAVRGWLGLGLGCFALYAFATLFPRGDTWGVHALAYLPAWTRVVGLALCFTLLWRPLQERAVTVVGHLARPLLSESMRGYFLLLAGTGIAFFVFYRFPIRTEVYGDTRTILRFWNDDSRLSATWLSSLFDLRLQHNDAPLTGVLLRTVAHTFRIPIEQAFRVTSALAGALTLCLWTQFVRSTFPGSRWAPLLLVAGFTLGAWQIFFGHVETYAFVFLTMMMFLLAGYLLIEGRVSFWLVGVLFAFALRAHAATVCFVPALVFLGVAAMARRHAAAAAWLTVPRVLAFLVAPCLGLGALLYVFYFRSFAAPYAGAGGVPPPTFLPMVPSAGPWNYALFSSAHLLDLGNVLLMIAMPVLLVLVGIALLHRRGVDWRHPTVIYAFLATLFPLIFFASVNPLLSLPRDWDLCALLAAPLLILFAAVLSHSDEAAVPTAAPYGSALAFGVFSIAFWVLNAWPAPLSTRLEQVGEHVFRTYHASASYLIGTAQGMDPDTTAAIARRVATLKRLAPSFVAGDPEATHLIMMLATVYRARGDRADAVMWVDRASAIAPDDVNLALFRADYLLWANQTQGAQRCIAGVLARQSGNFDALVLAAVTAAREKNYAAASGFLARAAVVRPGDADVAAWSAEMRAKQAQLAAAPKDRP